MASGRPRPDAAWTVSRDSVHVCCSTIAPASRSECPAACELPAGSSRPSPPATPFPCRTAWWAVPGRASSHSARSRLPSTKRRLVRVNGGPANRDTVRYRRVADPRVSMGQQNLRPFEFAHRMLAPAQHRRELRAFPLVQFHPYRMFIAGSPAVEGNDDRAAGDSHPDFTPRQGQYLAFIHAYTLVNGRPPAQADIQRFFQVTPPSVHQMLLTLERGRLISRRPGVPRSIAVLVDRSALPNLEPGMVNRSKSLCKGVISRASA